MSGCDGCGQRERAWQKEYERHTSAREEIMYMSEERDWLKVQLKKVQDFLGDRANDESIEVQDIWTAMQVGHLEMYGNVSGWKKIASL